MDNSHGKNTASDWLSVSSQACGLAPAGVGQREPWRRGIGVTPAGVSAERFVVPPEPPQNFRTSERCL